MADVRETVIIGAGPAGLTAAYLLAKEGRDVVVLEADPAQVGGISRTVNYKGFLFDIGGHRFFSKSREIVELWDELLPNDFLERPRLSRIYYGGRFYSYPLKAVEALRNLGVLQSAACVLSYLYARLTPIKEPRTFHEWVRNQFGERLFSVFFKTYTEKVWGMSCDDLSADWAAQRIKGLDLATAVLDGLRRSVRLTSGRNGSQSGIKTLIESFRYPRRGPGMMWDAAAEKVRRLGGEVRLGRVVEGLSFERGTGLWTVTARLQDGDVETYYARNVISSAPIRELMRSLRPIPESVFYASQLKYRDFLTVALMAEAGESFPDNWVYIHDPTVKVGRVQNFRSWSPEMVPESHLTCLGLEYFCFEGDGLWTASDEDLIRLAKAEISKIGLLKIEEILDACVVRQPKAYPVYDEHYREHVRKVRHDLAKHFPTLHLVGRNGMHKYNNQDHAMMTAMLTVRNILAGRHLYNVWDVNEDAEYGESGQSGQRDALMSERLVPRRAA